MSEQNRKHRALDDYAPEIISNAQKTIEKLSSKSYDSDSIIRFAKAARSWCERNSQEWFVWEAVVLLSVASQ